MTDPAIRTARLIMLAAAAGSVLLILLVGWVAIAGMCWSARNPVANTMTFWTHFPDAMTFKKLPQFQEPSK